MESLGNILGGLLGLPLHGVVLRQAAPELSAMRKQENFVLFPENALSMVEPHSIAKLLSKPSLLADPCSITTMMDGTALHSESLDWSAPVVSGLNLEHICLRSRESGSRSGARSTRLVGHSSRMQRSYRS